MLKRKAIWTFVKKHREERKKKINKEWKEKIDLEEVKKNI